MYASYVAPANGGILVEFYRDPAAHHAHGRIVAKGSGVPWLNVGDRVAYDVALSSEVAVAVSGLPNNLPFEVSYPVVGSDSGGPRATLLLIDQRNVLAVLHD